MKRVQGHLRIYPIYRLMGPEEVLRSIRENRPSSRSSGRDLRYMEKRINYEMLARKLFIEKGGKPTRKLPHYMVVEECEWLLCKNSSRRILI